jgi:protein-arginine kinase activator protein McsA
MTKFNEDDVSQIPDDNISNKSIVDLNEELEKGKKEFKKLLDSIQNTDNGLKNLWMQIYNNAVTDRRNAYVAFGDLYVNIHGKDNGEGHITGGLILSKYLERMEKANAQLIKLSELIDKARESEDDEEENNVRDIYASLQSKTAIKK